MRGAAPRVSRRLAHDLLLSATRTHGRGEEEGGAGAPCEQVLTLLLVKRLGVFPGPREAFSMKSPGQDCVCSINLPPLDLRATPPENPCGLCTPARGLGWGRCTARTPPSSRGTRPWAAQEGRGTGEPPRVAGTAFCSALASWQLSPEVTSET